MIMVEKPQSTFMVVSYYTRKSGYEREVKKLVASCERFQIHHHIAPYDSRGSWDANTRIKAEFMWELCNSGYRMPMVFVDADAIIHQYPTLFDQITTDLGLSFRDFGAHPSIRRRGGRELLSGTIYFQPNKYIVKNMFADWMDLNKRNPAVWEQKNLESVVKSYAGRVTITELPPTYCKIFDLMRNAGAPVIEHYQRSRRYKREVNAAGRGQFRKRMLTTGDIR